MRELARIANALEHIAWPYIEHEECDICTRKKNAGLRPVKRMPPSKVPDTDSLIRREQEIRTSKMLHGPEEPVADTFRYRELNRSDR